jgi:AraC-like DNA-binding protein
MVTVHQPRLASSNAGAAWPDLVKHLFGHCEVEVGDAAEFRGSITHSRLGRLELANVVSSREVSRRTARHIVHDNRDGFILVHVVRGTVRLRQGEHDIEMPEGSFTVYASGRPSLWMHNEPTEIRNVAMPATMLRARLRNIDHVLCRPSSSQTPMWRLTSDFLMSVVGQIRELPEHAAYGVAGQLFELVALALETDDRGVPLGAETVHIAVRRQCDAYIRTHIADATLDPETIAADIGISVRSLHRVFRETGETLGDCVRRERLIACHSMLADPGKARLSIAEIAYRAGFRSQAHFANAFKRHYGIPAGEWRRQAAGPRV